MENVRKHHDNYDFVLKEVMSLYTNKSLEFLGIQGKVKELLNAENVEVEIRKTLEDQVLKLDTGDGVDIEWESDISLDDLLRFAGYNIALTRKFKMPFVTVIVTRKKVRHSSYIGGSISFTPKILNLKERDGRATLKAIREKLDRGESINPLEAVFVPLYNKGRMSYEGVYKTIIELMPRITPDKNEQDMLLILSALLANKLVDDSVFNRILEAIKVTLTDNRFFKLIKKEGIEEGKKEEKRKAAKNLLILGVPIDTIKKALFLTDNEIDEIQKELVPLDN